MLSLRMELIAQIQMIHKSHLGLLLTICLIFSLDSSKHGKLILCSMKMILPLTKGTMYVGTCFIFGFIFFREVESMCQTPESKDIAKIVMNSSKERRGQDVATILEGDWQSFRCCIELTITIQRPKGSDETSKNSQPNIKRTTHLMAHLNFFHFLILARKYRFLLQFLNSFQGQIDFGNVEIDDKKKTFNDVKKPSRNDSWIFGANYLHLAVKYCPEALEILLQDSRCDLLIYRPSTKRNVYPLHLAVMNESNLSAK